MPFRRRPESASRVVVGHHDASLPLLGLWRVREADTCLGSLTPPRGGEMLQASRSLAWSPIGFDAGRHDHRSGRELFRNHRSKNSLSRRVLVQQQGSRAWRASSPFLSGLTFVSRTHSVPRRFAYRCFVHVPLTVCHGSQFRYIEEFVLVYHTRYNSPTAGALLVFAGHDQAASTEMPAAHCRPCPLHWLICVAPLLKGLP